MWNYIFSFPYAFMWSLNTGTTSFVLAKCGAGHLIDVVEVRRAPPRRNVSSGYDLLCVKNAYRVLVCGRKIDLRTECIYTVSVSGGLDDPQTDLPDGLIYDYIQQT
jgi:hypothetical protein